MKIIALVVGLVTGVLLMTGLVAPVATDAAITEKTFENEGYYTMDEIDDSTTRVIEWTKSTPNEITIDGDSFDMSWTDVGKSYTLIGSDSLIVRYERGANNTAGIQLFSTTSGASYVSFHTNSASDAGSTVTVTLESGVVTFVTDGTVPLNKTVSNIGTDAYIINPDNTGNYSIVMKKANMPAYLNGDSTIRFIGVSVTSGPNGIALYGIGTIEDGMTLSTIYCASTVSDVTYSDPVATYTEDAGYIDLYSLDKYTFTISYDDNGTDKTFDATYSYFLVPAEVTAELSNHLDPSEIAMVSATVIIGLVALIAYAAYSIRGREFD